MFRRGIRGFSLVELVVVLAIAAILLSLATPAYMAQARRGYRASAIGQLLTVASCQERLRALRGRYDTSACLPGPAARYSFEYADATAGPADRFTVVATPLAWQAQDPCGRLMLEDTGTRRVGGAADPARCWSAR